MVQLLLNCGADVNAQDAKSSSALSVALGDYYATKRQIGDANRSQPIPIQDCGVCLYGEDIGSTEKCGQCHACNHKVVQLLLDYGAEENGELGQDSDLSTNERISAEGLEELQSSKRVNVSCQ